MNKITLIPIIFLIFFASSFAQVFEKKSDNFLNQDNYKLTALQRLTLKDTVVSNSTLKEKSWLLGVGLSALLPGAGQFYAKSYIKAAIFLTVEALSWGAYVYFQNKGNKKTDEFQGYADQNWDIRKYAQWLKDEGFEGSGGIVPNETDLNVLRQQLNVCEAQNFSHTLPELYSQQYYELIGKYQNFVAGWADATGVNKSNFQTYKSPMYSSYAADRQKANDFFNYASTGMMFVVLNHILSAADAAWSVSIFNKNIKMKAGLSLNRVRIYSNSFFTTIPQLNLQVGF